MLVVVPCWYSPGTLPMQCSHCLPMDGFATAHEGNVEAAVQQAAPQGTGRRRQTGRSLKDLKSDPFVVRVSSISRAPKATGVVGRGFCCQSLGTLITPRETSSISNNTKHTGPRAITLPNPICSQYFSTSRCYFPRCSWSVSIFLVVPISGTSPPAQGLDLGRCRTAGCSNARAYMRECSNACVGR